jgi:HK97 family phage major capsid protein
MSMADTKEYLLAEIKKRLDRARELTDTADKAVRDLTEEETTEIKSLMTRVEEHKIEVKRIEDREALNDQLDSLGMVAQVATQETVEVPAKTIGEALTKSKDYQAIVAEAARSGMPQFSLPTIELKAAGDPVLESTGDNATAIAPTWDPNLYTPGLIQFPVRITQVLNTVQIANGNSVNYPKVTTRTASDAITVESQLKPGAEFAFDFVTVTLLKHAQFSAASEEMFQDAPVIASYINTQLGLMVQQAEEAYIADTLYTASTTAADGSGINASPLGYDAVLEAMTLIRVAGGNPNAVLINPNDWARLASTRAVAGDGSYFSGGPYAAPAQSLWGGLTEVQTPAVPEGTALVGDFARGATLYRKGGLRVDTSNSHDNYFRRNLIALRAEIRSVLGAHYPEFFVEVEIGS